jgi:hypothetical protein
MLRWNLLFWGKNSREYVVNDLFQRCGREYSKLFEQLSDKNLNMFWVLPNDTWYTFTLLCDKENVESYHTQRFDSRE